ncbi:MAG: hypothetical protein LBS64_02005 [Spirochaetaceae bacterium]|jgi:hypothetical protein|nr:hypothetical protein [Spirochaetaceae bacterium]
MMRKVLGICGILFLALLTALAAQSAGPPEETRPLPKTLEVYGAVTDTQDTDVVNMAQDLFFTQLMSLDGYTIIDSRGIAYSDAVFASSGDRDVILFYPEISQSGAGWQCTLHAKVPARKTEAAVSNHYDTYYKVLTDARSSLQAVLQSLESQAGSDASVTPDVAFQETLDSPGGLAPTLESLAGSWHGELLTDKIIILRGGRGFVIFKNGATMNVSVQIDGASVVITQMSKANASFFPEMPRDSALLVAQANPPPILWRFQMDNPARMSGTKRTVAVQGKTQRFADVPVVWNRD